jgi:hypothetical protein
MSAATIIGATFCAAYRIDQGFLPDHGFLLARGLPRLSLPTAMSQLCSVQFGHWAGLPSIRFTQEWPQRRHLHTMHLGIGIPSVMVYHFIVDLISITCHAILQGDGTWKN